MKLKISDDLALPLDAVTRRMAILAMSGSGKSNVAVVLAEAMYDAGIPWVAIDGKGDWFGIRSSADGKTPGLAVPIFGGLHGDLPLESGAGAYIANLIVDQRLTCIVDISEFATRQDMWAFMIAFGETLLRRNREALHLFLEECDDYIPQKTSEGGNQPKCKSVWQRVVKRGRFRGIGCTQISQRSATIDKDTLYQAEVLIALRATGLGDRKAVKGWVEYHNAANEIVASLPTLADGEGWVSSPAWLRTTERVRFLRRRTFDSGATPVLTGGKKAPAPTLSDVDLAKIRTEMAATIERAKADDPKALRAQLAERDRKLAELGRQMTAAAARGMVADPAELDRAREEGRAEGERSGTLRIRQLADPYKSIAAMIERAERDLDSVKSWMTKIGNEAAAAIEATEQERANSVATPRPSGAAHGQSRGSVAPAPRASVPRPARAAVGPGDPSLGKGERATLTAVAQYDAGVDRVQLSILTGYKRSTRDTYVQRLREAGLVELAGDRVVATQAGFDALGSDFEPLPTGAALREHWLERLPEGERKILALLIDAYPDEVDRNAISDATGYARSSRDTYLQRLSARKLVTGSRGAARASEVLFA